MLVFHQGLCGATLSLPESLLFVSTLDGNLHAVSKRSGSIQWTLKEGKLRNRPAGLSYTFGLFPTVKVLCLTQLYKRTPPLRCRPQVRLSRRPSMGNCIHSAYCDQEAVIVIKTQWTRMFYPSVGQISLTSFCYFQVFLFVCFVFFLVITGSPSP